MKFNAADAAFAVETELPAFRYWLRAAKENDLDVGTNGDFDFYDIAVCAIARVLITAGVPTVEALNFAVHAIVDLGGADSDWQPEDLWKVWEHHQFCLGTDGKRWELHDVSDLSDDVYVGVKPKNIIKKAIERAIAHREERKAELLERKFGT